MLFSVVTLHYIPTYHRMVTYLTRSILEKEKESTKKPWYLFIFLLSIKNKKIKKKTNCNHEVNRELEVKIRKTHTNLVYWVESVKPSEKKWEKCLFTEWFKHIVSLGISKVIALFLFENFPKSKELFSFCSKWTLTAGVFQMDLKKKIQFKLNYSFHFSKTLVLVWMSSAFDKIFGFGNEVLLFMKSTMTNNQEFGFNVIWI